MKRVFYSSGSLLTGDRTADAVVKYAEVLAARSSSDTIDIPIVLEDGTVARAQLLIGPASQLVVVPQEHSAEAPDDDATIEELSKRTLSLSSPHPQAVDAASAAYYSEGNDYPDATGDGDA
jgi:hypothetical protein